RARPSRARGLRRRPPAAERGAGRRGRGYGTPGGAPGGDAGTGGGDHRRARRGRPRLTTGPPGGEPGTGRSAALRQIAAGLATGIDGSLEGRQAAHRWKLSEAGRRRPISLDPWSQTIVSHPLCNRAQSETGTKGGAMDRRSFLAGAVLLACVLAIAPRASAQT